jgi:sigma-E factor negative regulatory protein RseC
MIETGQDFEPGDELLLGLSEAALVRASLTVYGLPLLGMVLAGLLAVFFGLAEAWVALISIAGFFAGFKFGSFLADSLEADRLTPYIVDIRVNPGPLPGS